MDKPERRHGSTRVPVHAVNREGTVIKGGGPKIEGTRWTVPERRHWSILECQSMPWPDRGR